MGNTRNSDRLYFGRAPKITAVGDCRHEIKRHLFLGRKVMTNLDSILKSRDITLTTKVCLVKAMVFPVVMYGCESGTIKKAEHRRADAFELWCWRRLLRVPWTARRSNQSILKEISPEYSLEGLMLKMKLQILWPLDAKNWLISKDPDAGQDWRQEEEGTTEDEMIGWHHQLNGHVWVSSGSWWWTVRPGVLQSMGSQRVGHNWATELNWTEPASLLQQPLAHTFITVTVHILHHSLRFISVFWPLAILWAAMMLCSSVHYPMYRMKTLSYLIFVRLLKAYLKPCLVMRVMRPCRDVGEYGTAVKRVGSGV